MKLIVGVIAMSLAFLTNFFASSNILSISAAYHEGGWSQNFFVGFLFAISAFLLAYNGESRSEMILSKVAAVAALGVALFPCECDARDQVIDMFVVGNITVGGTGKTPFTIWLAEQLQARGLSVGIVLRGYGGSSSRWPRDVTAESDSVEVGDEAVLLAQRTNAIVVAAPDRVAAARRAIERGAAVVVSDDGLQHYRLGRDCEVAVVDSERQLGNARLLPAGPLREPASRLGQCRLGGPHASIGQTAARFSVIEHRCPSNLD